MSQNHPRPLRPKQRQAAEFLAKGYSITDAASMLYVRRETISRWKTDPRFTALVASYRQEMHALAMQRMPELFDAAVIALSEQLRRGENRTWAALGLLRLFGADRLLQALAPTPPCITMEECTKP